jgi:hypothetical protein
MFSRSRTSRIPVTRPATAAPISKKKTDPLAVVGRKNKIKITDDWISKVPSIQKKVTRQTKSFNFYFE